MLTFSLPLYQDILNISQKYTYGRLTTNKVNFPHFKLGKVNTIMEAIIIPRGYVLSVFFQ